MTKRKTHELAMLASDAYKFYHRELYPVGTEYVYSNMTPRTNSYFKYDNHYVALGSEMFVERFLIDYFNKNFFNLPLDEVKEDYAYIIKNGLGDDVGNTDPIESLHNLGYLPLEIKALPEGSHVKVGVPMLTVVNTLPEFFWLTNFIETALISETFPVFTAASIAREYKKIGRKYAELTCDNEDHLPWQFHDFSRRGQHGNDSGLTTSIGHLSSFTGTDSVQSALTASNYYGADLDEELVYGSVLATEHSVASAYGEDGGEYDYYADLIRRFPNGILSMVSDTYDYFNVLTDILPSLKDEIMERDGKLVIRPDSGKPIDIICGRKFYDLDLTFVDSDENEDYEYEILDLAHAWASEACEGSYNLGEDRYTVKYKTRKGVFSVEVEFEYNRHDKTYYYVDNYQIDWSTKKEINITPEDKGSLELLWETFGGTINSKGYRVLDSHIGLLFGEGITLDNVGLILERMKEKGFAASNVVFGVGAYSYSVSVTRDSLSVAFKTTAVVIDGKERHVSKNPKDASFKKSAKGGLKVIKNEDGEYELVDGLNIFGEKHDNHLETIFKDGGRTRHTHWSTIKDRIDNSIKTKGDN